MSKQSTELAWDITDWDNDADLTATNLLHNLEETFLSNGLILPASIICRPNQELKLRGEYYNRNYNPEPDGTGINKIYTQFGVFKLKVLPLYRSEITYTRAIR